MEQLLFFGYVSVGILVGSLNAKALSASVTYSIGLLMVYPDASQAAGLMAIYIVAVVLSNFRD